MCNVIDFSCHPFTDKPKCIYCENITNNKVEINIKMIPRLKDKLKGHIEENYVGIVYCCVIDTDIVKNHTYTGWDDWDIYDNIIETLYY
jgi:hypothetical protein